MIYGAAQRILRSREPEECEMPLSQPVEREHLHLRDIQVRGYRRGDGLMDIEAHLRDLKSHPFTNTDRGTVPVGEPLHEMWVRLTVDRDLTIIASEASTEHGPFSICPHGADSFSRLAGLSIRAGFLKAANQRLGGTEGCTHLRELLQQVATTAFQTMWSMKVRRESEKDPGYMPDQPAVGKPPTMEGATRLVNTCFAYASDGPVVQRRWPQLYTGAAETAVQ
jgi:hypothetical protein